MPKDEYEIFLMMFYKYGANPNFNIETDDLFVHSMYGTQIPYGGRQTVNLQAKFPVEGFNSFMEDMVKFQKMLRKEKEEQYLRELNPTAQQAYEEYQIIINLIK
jgi:hypothetical protein